MTDNKVQLIIELVDNFDRALGQLKREVTGFETHTNSSISSINANWLKLTAALASIYVAYKKVFSPTMEYLGTIETAELGIASAFLTSGQYIDEATGKALAGSAALKAAQADAAGVIKDLQAANLQTIATLDQLVRAYQETLPVAMRVGFNKQQTQEFTVATVQAAGAIGLSLDMLAEETRSLLTGVITPRTSRIAVVLGLTNEDIRRNSGNADQLYNFLMGKLSAYRLAGIETQKTWNGLWSNVKDISQQALGQAFEPLFENIKSIVYDITNDIITIDKTTKQIKWNPEFLEGINTIRNSLSGLAELIKSLTPRGQGLNQLAQIDVQLEYWRNKYKKDPGIIDNILFGSDQRIKGEIEKEIQKLEQQAKILRKKWFVHRGTLNENPLGGDAAFNQNAPGGNAEDLEREAKAAAKLTAEYEALKLSLEREIAMVGLDDLDKKLFAASNEFEDLLKKKLGADKAETIWEMRMKLINEEELQKSIDAMGDAFKALEKEFIPSEADRQKITDFWGSVEYEKTQATGTELDIRLADNKQHFDSLREEARGSLVYHEEIEKAITQIDALEEKARADIRAQYASERREAELNTQLALLDIAEKEHSLSRADLVSERLRLTRELLAVEQQRLEDASPEKDSQAWDTINNKIKGYRGQIIGLTEEQRELTGTFTEGLIEGLRRYNNEAQPAFKGGLEALKSATTSMESELGGFFDYASDQFIDFGKLAEDILHDIYMALMKALIIQPLVQGITGGIQGLMGPGTGMTPEMTGWDMAYHKGGVIVPRFHWGGRLASDEVPLIGQTGEGVLSRKGMAALDRLNSGISGGGNVVVQVNVENKSSIPVNAKQTGTSFDGKKYVVGVVLEDFSNFGPISQAMGRK